jgi:hypothetical protein
MKKNTENHKFYLDMKLIYHNYVKKMESKKEVYDNLSRYLTQKAFLNRLIKRDDFESLYANGLSDIQAFYLDEIKKIDGILLTKYGIVIK